MRALLTDEDARLITLSRHSHQFQPDATTNPHQLRRLIEDCIDQVLTHPAAQHITAVGMATFVGNLLVDDTLYTYADTRASSAAEALSKRYDMEEIHARTGCRIHSAYHPAKLHWLKSKSAHYTDFATYCYSLWFGRDVPCSYSVASWSGLLNRHTLTWDETWLTALNLTPEMFPTLADFTAVQIGLAPDYAARWSILRDVPFYLAVGDGAAANIGSGGTTADSPVLTIGTTAAMRIVTSTLQPVSAGLWSYRVDAARHLIGGATNEGGNIFAWARETLRLDQFDDALLQRQVGEHGLNVLPLLAGERSPGYRADAVGVIHGLRLDTSPLDILHAMLEGVALRLRLIYDLMGRPGDYVLAGGGALSQSPAWRQILADVLAVPLHMVDSPEATARGVALLITGKNTPPPILEIIQPRETDRIQELLDRQQNLFAC